MLDVNVPQPTYPPHFKCATAGLDFNNIKVTPYIVTSNMNISIIKFNMQLNIILFYFVTSCKS